jgi:tetratricopeptide (TPR) repeat protein
MDPATLEAIARQAAVILAPALPFIYEGSKAAVTKGTDVLGDMLYEKAFEKIGSKGGKKAKALLEKISPKMTESLGKALTKVSRNSEDPAAKEDLQQEILKLLRENPDLAREIEVTINLNIENIENIDQFAVGNYNTFFNFETPSRDEFIKINEYLDHRRKEAANQEIQNRYNPSALLYYPEKLKQFVTQNRAEELRKDLTYLENHRILLLSGIGGVGKSTLARALVDLRPINAPEPFWFNFNQNQDAKLGDILEKLAAYMNAPEIAAFKAERREPGKADVDKLTDELQKRSQVWLIFDDLSTMLEDQQFTDKGIELFFSSLRYNAHNAKVIVTSRILPMLENGESLIDVVEEEKKQNLKGLKKDFAVDYLTRKGLSEVEPEKLEELAIGVDGHPLALKLLVELVKEFGVKDTLEDLSMYQESKDDTIKKARKLFDKLAGEEKELLERFSVYREPVDLKGLKEMFTENTPKNATKKLIDKSLLETAHNGSYWLHPLVQEFSYEDLENKKEAHMLAVKYYLSLSLPENPTKKEDLQPAIEAHHHACMAEEYDLAADIIGGCNLPYLLSLWGNPRTLIEIYEKLLPEDHFKDETILKDKQVHGAVLGNLGLAYSDLGEPRKAIEHYEKALKISREMGNRRGEGNHLGNLGIAYSHLGSPRKAIEYYGQALKISREVGDRRGEGNVLGNMGLAYSDLGKPRKAIEFLKQSLDIGKAIEDPRIIRLCEQKLKELEGSDE